jgi:hypothetical protein
MKYISHKSLQFVYEIFFPPDLYTWGSFPTATARTEATAHYVGITTTVHVKAGAEPLSKRHA